MTKREAAYLLDPETRQSFRVPYRTEISLQALFDEACLMGANALRAQQERENPKPLTLDELREMNGEPVYIDDWFEDFHGYELSEDARDYFEGDSRTEKTYGTRWVAYRHKPKEG